MQITKKLPSKYALNQFNPAEKEVVESWLKKTDDTDTTPFRTDFVKAKPRMWRNINLKKQTKIIPLYKKLTRYAAAACILMAVFIVGRYATTAENTVYAKEQAGNLIVYGSNGTYAKIPGNTFSLQFDGQLKLHSGSSTAKTTKVGDATYILAPGKTYYLIRNHQHSSLIPARVYGNEMIADAQINGDFSITNITS
ncbi:MAG: hypothetical protein AAF600_12075 [Bacteroidota bacterium]